MSVKADEKHLNLYEIKAGGLALLTQCRQIEQGLVLDATFVQDWRAGVFDKSPDIGIICVLATLSIDVSSPSVQHLTLTRVLKTNDGYD
jgi:hypothetical protein